MSSSGWLHVDARRQQETIGSRCKTTVENRMIRAIATMNSGSDVAASAATR
jgi:hypothetical protein